MLALENSGFKWLSPTPDKQWLLEEFDGLYDPYSGITNNLSESYNAVMKQENDWMELPDDTGGNESAVNDI
jgi:hypothetical protein